MASASRGRTRTKYYKDNPKRVRARNLVLNAVSRIAYALAGGSARFYSLPASRRVAIREHAKKLHHSGVQVARAAEKAAEKERDGFVYIVTNPAFPGFVKIGCALDACSRLADYQTYCPFRAYTLEHSVYTSDRLKAESIVHSLFADRRAAGEWFRISLQEAVFALEIVREFIVIKED